MAKRRNYSDEDKANALLALEANGGNVHRTATELGIPVNTLRGWSKGVGVNHDVSEVRQQKRPELIDKLQQIAYQITEVMPAKIENASLQSLGVTLGIVIDKQQLLMNQPTTIVDERTTLHGHINMTESERIERINSLFDKARNRRTGQTTDDPHH